MPSVSDVITVYSHRLIDWAMGQEDPIEASAIAANHIYLLCKMREQFSPAERQEYLGEIRRLLAADDELFIKQLRDVNDYLGSVLFPDAKKEERDD